jgi:hypothetical protein
LGNEQAPSQYNNQTTEAPIHVGYYILHQGHGKGQGGSPNSTLNNRFCLSKIVT